MLCLIRSTTSSVVPLFQTVTIPSCEFPLLDGRRLYSRPWQNPSHTSTVARVEKLDVISDATFARGRTYACAFHPSVLARIFVQTFLTARESWTAIISASQGTWRCDSRHLIFVPLFIVIIYRSGRTPSVNSHLRNQPPHR